jgi:sortase A
MKRALIVIVITLLGIAVLAYPKISNYFAEKNGSQAIQEYSEAINEYSDKELKDAWDAATEYNETLTGSPVHDPFLEGSGMAMPENYSKVLDLGGIMGYVEIPKIGVYLPIYHGTSEAVLDKGVGHLEGSTMPIGGPGTHSVLTGHTGLIHARLFTDLVELKEGDMFYVHVLGQTLAYKVNQIKVVEPHNTEDLRRTTQADDYCTLLTCTPYGINSHRLLVRGARTDYIPDVKENIVQTAGSSVDRMVFAAGTITLVVMETIIFIVLFMIRKKRRREREAQI